MKFLKNVQSKSSVVKTHYALGISGAVTGIIALIWLSTIPAQFAALTPPQNQDMNEDQDIGSFDSLLNDAKDQLGNVIDSTGQLAPLEVKTTNLDSLGTESLIAPDFGNDEQNVDQIAYPYVETGEMYQASTTTPQIPEDSTEVIKVPTHEDEPAPRMILIGTTTTHQ